VAAHTKNESRLLADLTVGERGELAGLLRRVLAHLEREVGGASVSTEDVLRETLRGSLTVS
jgi:hypothetical protein